MKAAHKLLHAENSATTAKSELQFDRIDIVYSMKLKFESLKLILFHLFYRLQSDGARAIETACRPNIIEESLCKRLI